jgi:hypothetical protein
VIPEISAVLRACAGAGRAGDGQVPAEPQRRAAAALTAVGHTSGAAMLRGLALGARTTGAGAGADGARVGGAAAATGTTTKEAA